MRNNNNNDRKKTNNFDEEPEFLDESDLINDEDPAGRKYMTVTIGKDFRTIAKVMSSNSFKMNHATARNQTFGALHSLLLNFSKEAKGKKVKSKEMYEILNDPEIYDNLSEILFASVKEEIQDLLIKQKENK